MVFSSLTFLCIFLPVVLALYYLLPTLRIRNILLIAVSLLFYAYGEPVYVLLMIASIIINYIFGRLLGTENKKKRQWILAIAVVINIGLLVVFKYLDMMVQTCLLYTSCAAASCISSMRMGSSETGTSFCVPSAR